MQIRCWLNNLPFTSELGHHCLKHRNQHQVRTAQYILAIQIHMRICAANEIFYKNAAPLNQIFSQKMVCIRRCMWHVLSQLLARDLKHLTQNCCLQADEPMECLQEEQAALHMASLSWFYFLEIILQALFKGEGARLKTGATGCHTIELNLPKIPNSTHRLSWCKQPHLTQETRAV